MTSSKERQNGRVSRAESRRGGRVASATTISGDASPRKEASLSKKCFLLLVIGILIGISVSIVHVLKVKKAAEAEAEFQRTSTTVTTTTTPALEDLSDEQILEKCKNKYNGVLGKSTIATFTGWNGHVSAWHFSKFCFFVENLFEQWTSRLITGGLGTFTPTRARQRAPVYYWFTPL